MWGVLPAVSVYLLMYWTGLACLDLVCSEHWQLVWHFSPLRRSMLTGFQLVNWSTLSQLQTLNWPIPPRWLLLGCITLCNLRSSSRWKEQLTGYSLFVSCLANKLAVPQLRPDLDYFKLIDFWRLCTQWIYEYLITKVQHIFSTPEAQLSQRQVKSTLCNTDYQL